MRKGGRGEIRIGKVYIGLYWVTKVAIEEADPTMSHNSCMHVHVHLYSHVHAYDMIVAVKEKRVTSE
jgi:hypothetical protein